MTITSVQMATLRALLTGADAAFGRLSMEPDVIHGDGFPVLVAAALVGAARRRFRTGWSEGDVIQFIGKVRSAGESAHTGLSASAAEQVLLSALRGEPVSRELNEDTRGYAQVAVLAELVSDLDTWELDQFLAETRQQADMIPANQGHSNRGLSGELDHPAPASRYPCSQA
jgi:hypothetical protein